MLAPGNKENNLAKLGLIRIKQAELSDIDGMAHCHITCFPELFTNHMGLPFARSFYKTYLSRTDGLAFVAVDQTSKQVVGLIAGGHPDIRYNFLRRAGIRFLGTLLFKCLVDRVVRAKLINQLAKLLGLNRASDTTDDVFQQRPCETEENGVLLQVICVLDEYRRMGVGKKLIQAFECACQQSGCGTLNLNVASNNTAAIAFYRKLGWKVVIEKAGSVHMKTIIADRYG